MGATSHKTERKDIWVAFRDSSSADKWDQNEADQKKLFRKLNFLILVSQVTEVSIDMMKVTAQSKFYFWYCDLYSAFIEEVANKPISWKKKLLWD